SLEGVDLPRAAVPVIGLDGVKPLEHRVDARGGCRAEAGAGLGIFELEIAGEDQPAFEADALQRIDCGGASTSLEVLSDEALRVLRGSGNRDAAEQQRDRERT